MRGLAVLLSGALFGAGLAVSGMVDPAKVRAFLDLGGAWDPTLLLVMGAAVGVTALGTRTAVRRGRPFWDARFHLHATWPIDARLLGGAALFGLGWGISGICPGPAVAGLALGQGGAVLFLLAMAAGTLAARALLGLPRPGTEAEPGAEPGAEA